MGIRDGYLLAATGHLFTGSEAQGAVAGQYSYVGLQNPAASGKVISLSRVIFASPSAIDVHLFRRDTALANLTGSIAQHRVLSDATIAAIRDENTATDYSGSSSQIFFTLPVAAGDSQIISFRREPMILAEGEQIVMQTVQQNVTFRTSWSWEEL